MAKMKRVYVAGRYRAPTNLEIQKNIDKAADVAWCMWALGAAVFCPHLNTPLSFQGSLPDERWLDGDLEFIRLMDAMVMLQGWESSAGASREYDLAMTLNIPVFFWSELGRYAISKDGVSIGDWLNGTNR